MMLLVSQVNRKLVIPGKKTSFPNKETLVYEFTAGVPLEVIDEVAISYSESYPYIFSIVESEEKVEVKPKEAKAEAKVFGFDAVSYLTNNPQATEEELKNLKQSELLAVCEALTLKANFNTGVDKLAAKIAQELVIRNAKG
jgi:hypothetical protein